jgi:hypothetical protein
MNDSDGVDGEYLSTSEADTDVKLSQTDFEAFIVRDSFTMLSDCNWSNVVFSPVVQLKCHKNDSILVNDGCIDVGIIMLLKVFLWFKPVAKS